MTESNSRQDTPYRLDDISDHGKVRLLDMAYGRMRFGIVAMAFIAVLYSIYYRYEYPAADARLVIWAAAYLVSVYLLFRQHKRYRSEMAALSSKAFLEKWLPRIERNAVVHGVGVAALLPLVSDTAPLEMRYLYVLTVAAIMAGNATHQSPMISVFNRFLTFGWHSTVLMMPYTIPENWHYIMPLSALYSLGMYWHALKSHRFFVQLIWLEEESSRLAENFKLAKVQAEDALKAKNQFLTTASHDLRQPVHAMGFLIESISLRNRDPDLEPSLDDLRRSVRSVTQMFNSLLDLSKIELGRIVPHIEPVALNPLLEEVATLYREEAECKGLRFHCRPYRTPVFALADKLLLKQSLINLVQNAMRYTPKGGVFVGIRARGEQWQIGVWDTGIGVASGNREQIYSPYFREEHAWQIDSAGQGIGLSVVKRCVELMHADYGMISVQNKGSQFWLRLPKAVAPAQLGWTPAADTAKRDGFQGNELSGKCLVVDDDPQVVNAWMQLMAAWGLEVACCDASQGAFDLLEQGFQPDVILCDQRLRAGESGFDLLQALLERCPSAHGLMVSGEFNSPELLEAENEGYLVLRKPVEPAMLHDVLSRWLDRDIAEPVSH